MSKIVNSTESHLHLSVRPAIVPSKLFVNPKHYLVPSFGFVMNVRNLYSLWHQRNLPVYILVSVRFVPRKHLQVRCLGLAIDQVFHATSITLRTSVNCSIRRLPMIGNVGIFCWLSRRNNVCTVSLSSHLSNPTDRIFLESMKQLPPQISRFN